MKNQKAWKHRRNQLIQRLFLRYSEITAFDFVLFGILLMTSDCMRDTFVCDERDYRCNRLTPINLRNIDFVSQFTDALLIFSKTNISTNEEKKKKSLILQLISTSLCYFYVYSAQLKGEGGR